MTPEKTIASSTLSPRTSPSAPPMSEMSASFELTSTKSTFGFEILERSFGSYDTYYFLIDKKNIWGDLLAKCWKSVGQHEPSRSILFRVSIQSKFMYFSILSRKIFFLSIQASLVIMEGKFPTQLSLFYWFLKAMFCRCCKLLLN